MLGPDQRDVAAMLARIQNDLFDLGADLCVPDRGEPLPYTPLRISRTRKPNGSNAKSTP